MIILRLEHILTVVVAAAASAVCARMLLGERRLPGCGAGSGCDAVMASRWARWGPLPVALPALAAYLAAMLASLLTMSGGMPAAARAAGVALLALAPVFAGAAAWFALLQLVVVRRLCGYCMAVHALGAAVAVLAIAAARGGGMEWAAVAGLTMPGWIALAAFIAGHVLLRPKMHQVHEPTGRGRQSGTSQSWNEGDPHPGPLPEYRARGQERRSRERDRNGGAPQRAAPVNRAGDTPASASRRIRAFGGRVDLAVDEWPVLGMPGAAAVAVFLFDYTCRECRHMRRLIAEAMDRHPAKLAVLLVPIPMDPRVLGTDTTGAGDRISGNRPDAVGYVRLAWALWRADPLAYMRFDHWLSAPTCTPPLRDAVAAARKFAPSADLNTAGRSELGRFIDERVARAVAIYRRWRTSRCRRCCSPARPCAGTWRPPRNWSRSSNGRCGLAASGRGDLARSTRESGEARQAQAPSTPGLAAPVECGFPQRRNAAPPRILGARDESGVARRKTLSGNRASAGPGVEGAVIGEVFRMVLRSELTSRERKRVAGCAPSRSSR